MNDRSAMEILIGIEHHLLRWINEDKQDNWHRATHKAWRQLEGMRYKVMHFHV